LNGRQRSVALLGLIGLVGGVMVATDPPRAQAAGATTGEQQWAASWTASPTDAATPLDAAAIAVPVAVSDQTFRMIVTPHLGGTVLRIHLSNRFGSAPMTFGHVTVGIAGSGSVQQPVNVTFGGQSGVTAPAGQDVVSDPVDLTFQAFQPLAVSIFTPGLQGAPTKHWNANATSYYSLPLSGDLASAGSDLGFPLATEAWMFVEGIDVEAPQSTGVVVAFGDSITDGFVASTVASLPVSLSAADKNGRYPDDLQRRIDAAGIPLSVVDAGISSNRLLTDGGGQFEGPSGLSRFQTDALGRPGVTGVLVLEGINDLGIPPATTTADQLIAGYQQLIAEAHAAGVKIWLGTIMPASNALFDGTLPAPQSETYREQVNAWIRSQQLADGVVDFDAAMRDPSDPNVLNPAYASVDNLHPNLLGYQVMANAVNLSMLGG